MNDKNNIKMKTFVIRVFYRLGFSIELIESETFNGACNDLFVLLPWNKAEKIIGFEDCQTGIQKPHNIETFEKHKFAGIII